MRRLVKQKLFGAFLFLDRLGVHLLPKHYYDPVPDFAWLRANRDAWTAPSTLPGIDWNLPSQFEWLAETCQDYYKEVAGLEFYNNLTRGEWGLGYGEIESQVLHCFIRKWNPKRIVEIGSGVSTMCMLHAAEKGHAEGRNLPEITCIEPFPSAALRRQTKHIQLVSEPCQTVPASVFAQLGSGDLLFVDCTHAVKVGSDVIRIYLDIIPNLAPGVFIHIHDIFLPYLYPWDVFFKPFCWQETALFTALLTNNDRLRVLSSLSALHYADPKRLKELLTDYKPADTFRGLALSANPAGYLPTSIWVQTR